MTRSARGACLAASVATLLGLIAWWFSGLGSPDASLERAEVSPATTPRIRATAPEGAGADVTTDSGTPAARRETHDLDSTSNATEVLRKEGRPLAIHVTDPAGTPVLGAKVRVYAKSLRGPVDLKDFDPAAFRVGRAAALEVTDAAGDAHFNHGVVPDTMVLVEADRFAPSFGVVTREEGEAGRSEFPLATAGSIQAKVIDGITSLPIPGATVIASLFANDQALEGVTEELTYRALTARRATTDLAGKCVLPQLSNDLRWCVWVFADGYPARRAYPVDPLPFEQLIRVFDGKPLHGRVVDVAGAGIPGVTVKGSVLGIYPGQEICWARSREDGTFDFDAIPEAPIYFLANKIGYAMEILTIGQPTAEPIEIVLRSQAPFSGVVVDDVGRPVAGARLDFSITERCASPGMFMTYDDGTFDMPWMDQSHSYLVDIQAEGHTPRRIAGVMPQTGLRLSIARRGSVCGRVADEQGNPVRRFKAGWIATRLPLAEEHYGRETLTWREFDSPDGTFILDAVDSGQVELLVASDGFERAESLEVVVPPGGSSSVTNVTLGALRSVSGRVVAPDGRPISGATIAWLLDSALGVPNGRATPNESKSDNAGQFTLSGLPDRPFQLRVTDNIHANALYPDLRVEEFPRDLVFAATSRIEGRILTPWRSPDSALVVSARPESAATYSPVTIGPDGRFSFGSIPAGTWIIDVEDFWSARAASAQTSKIERRIDVAAGETVFTEIDLRYLSRIVGYVTGALQPEELPRVEARLIPIDPASGRRLATIARASCEGDGRFVLFAVPPGRYAVAASSQIRGIGAGVEQEVVVDDDSSSIEVKLEFSDSTLRGRVADGDDHPVVADVRVVRERDGVTLFSVHTERDGGYRLAPPMGEKFHLLVTAPGFAEQRSGSFDADQAPDEPLEHVLEPEARLVIAVRDDAGGPVAGALVELRDAADRSATTGAPHWQGRSGADGVATATRLPAGAWSVTARHASWPDSPPVVADVEWGETRSVAMTLTRVGQAALRVTDPDGAPKADVVVTLAPVGRAASPRVSASDAHGRVVFERLEAGPWLASCEGAEAIPVAITPGGETTADLIVTGPRR
jgi:protocatechuate 3,4-dioxygenase beta subunit